MESESVIIELPDRRTIRVCLVSTGEKTRLGFDADRDIEIWREEIYVKKREERRERP